MPRLLPSRTWRWLRSRLLAASGLATLVAGAAGGTMGAPVASATPAAAPGALAAAPSPYRNPLRSIRSLRPERIDQGVDYGGTGPMYALGDGVVLNTVSGGWPDGVYICYRLTDGPAAGLVVYAAEDIHPLVHVGQQVTPATVIGTQYNGTYGIETGWGDTQGYAQAIAHNQWNGTDSTRYGVNFNRLLVSLGAPSGSVIAPVQGRLPPGWKG